VKDFIDLHDYLISSELVGDWDGDEEEVTDRINGFFHHAYQLFPEDITAEQAEKVFNEIWGAVAGQDFVIESEIDELESWLESFVNQLLNEIEYEE
jgi:hypothetical protein